MPELPVDLPLPRGRGAFVVAHPGHELRVHGFLEALQPIVFVLTDGSGGAGESRLQLTRHLVERAGARCGSIFGYFTDRALYEAILHGELQRFTSLVDELAQELEGQGSAYVAGDATEGYNPAHDVCRLLVDAAVTIVSARQGRALGNFAFPLTGLPSVPPCGCGDNAVRLTLDASAYQRKLQAARDYYPLRHEVDDAVHAAGPTAFQDERLFPVLASALDGMQPAEAPFYERYGQQQVAAGRYRQVLQYREHFSPLRQAIALHVKATLAT
ncbi:MAG TPA: hypothetical protein VE988_01240 [Gemmataceae bacterium]|nr:hypothetical protein [Gemmataceae bacterium]